MRFALILLVLAVTSPRGARAGDASAARRLVAELGNPSFAIREAATRKLTELGPAAKQALAEGIRSEHAEIRNRAERILDLVLEAEYEARIVAFAKDEDGTLGAKLPGWERFSSIAGEDPAARGLFVGMQREEPRLFRLLEEKSDRLGPRADERCRELFRAVDSRRYGGRAKLSYESIAVMLFLTGDEELETTDDTLANVQQFALRQELYYPASQGTRKEALARLLSHWLEVTTERAEPYGHIRVAIQYGLPAGLPPALKLLETPGAEPNELVQAMLALGRFGDKSHQSKLEPLLDDATIVYHASVENQVVPIQVRDFALAMLVHLSGQDLADFGFKRARASATTVYEQTSLTFENDEARDEALRKWKHGKQAS